MIDKLFNFIFIIIKFIKYLGWFILCIKLHTFVNKWPSFFLKSLMHIFQKHCHKIDIFSVFLFFVNCSVCRKLKSFLNYKCYFHVLWSTVLNFCFDLHSLNTIIDHVGFENATTKGTVFQFLTTLYIILSFIWLILFHNMLLSSTLTLFACLKPKLWSLQLMTIGTFLLLSLQTYNTFWL